MLKKKDTFLVASIYTILIIIFVLKSSMVFQIPEFLEKGIYLLVIFLSIIKLITTKWKIKEAVVCLLLLVLGVVTYITTTQSFWMFGILIIACSKGIDIDDLIRLTFRVNVVILIVHLIATLFACVGIGELVYLVRTDSGKVRYTLQFGHPNGCASVIFWTQMAWIYLKYYKLKFQDILLQIAISFMSFLLTDTLTSFICSNIVFLYLIAVKYVSRKRIQAILYHGTKFLLPIFFAFFAGITVMYRGALSSRLSIIVTVLDTVFNSRIRLGAAAYTVYGSTYFGQFTDVKSATYDSYYGLTATNFDNIYNFCFIQLGIITFLVIALMCYLIVKQNKPERTLAVFAVALYGCTEVSSINVFYAFPLLLFSTVIFSSSDMLAVKKKMNGRYS